MTHLMIIHSVVTELLFCILQTICSHLLQELLRSTDSFQVCKYKADDDVNILFLSLSYSYLDGNPMGPILRGNAFKRYSKEISEL